MPYIGNTTSDFSIDTGNITNRAVTATKLSPSSVGSNGQVLSVDGSGNLQWSSDSNAPEGTAVLSTGESGTDKYLRIDGDGTCSWQLAVDSTKIPLTGGTFSGDVSFFGGATNVLIHYDASDNALEFWDGTKAYFGTGSEDRLEIYHDSGTNYIKAPDGTLHLRADNFQLVSDDSGGRAIYLNNSSGHLELGFDGSHDAHFTGTGVTFLTDLTIPDKIIHSGDTDTQIRFPSADTIHLETGGTNRLKIDANGVVQITRRLELTNSGDNHYVYEGRSWAWSSTGVSTGTIRAYVYADSSNNLRIGTNGWNERLQISSTGQILSGTTSSNSSDANAIFAGGGNSGSGDYGKIYISGNYTNPAADQAVGFVGFSISSLSNHAFAYIGVYTDGAHSGSGDTPSRMSFHTTPDGSGTPYERLTIKGSGNIGISEATPINLLTVSNSAGQDDAVGNVQIRYTGSDGSSNSGLTVKNYKGTSQFMQWSDGGVRIGSRILTNSGAGNIYFTTGSDSVKAVLLASNGNLELSAGNLVVGNGKGIDFSADGNAGGMTNELLDDYEEGTHTITQVGSGGGVPLTLNICNYTKIGNICHVHGLIDVGASSGSSSVEFSLPFTSKAQSGGAYPRTTFALMHKHCNIHDSYKNIVGYVGQNENYWRIYNVGDNMDWHQFLSGDFTANSAEILFSVTYMTA